MNGCVAIDFQPGGERVPQILQVIGAGGFDLYGLHLIPSCAERWTLNVDLGRCCTRTDLQQLESALKGVNGIVEVIHEAGAQHAG